MATVLADTREMTREEWLAARRRGIGSSDAAAVCGLSPWQSPLAVYLDKIGELPDEEPSEVMEWGTRLEPLVADVWSERTGKRVRRRNAILQHPQYPFMLADVDRFVVGENAVLEVKTTSAFGREAWVDGAVPDHYVIQVQHQMAVTGCEKAYLAVLIGGNHLECREVKRDDEVIQRLTDIEAEFWRRVEERRPPDPDGSPADVAAIRRLYPESIEGKTVILPMDARDLLDARRAAKADLDAAEARLRAIDSKLQALVGDAEAAYLPGVSKPVVTWKTVISQRVDIEALKKAGLYEAYAKPSVSRRWVMKEDAINA